MRDVYATFSHVNIMFSRPALKAFAGVIARALGGELRQAARELISPLHAAFKRPIKAKKRVSPPGNGDAATWLLGPWAAQTKKGLQVEFRPFSFEGLQQMIETHTLASLVVSWRDLKVERIHVLPASGRGSLFSLVILQAPRQITRKPERTSRGEDFNERDRIECDSLADVRSATFRPPSNFSDWRVVKPMVVQYPVKMCLFQVSHEEEASKMTVVGIRRSGRSEEMDVADVGWAQWHEDPLQEHEEQAESTVQIFGRRLDALAGMLFQRDVILPANRPLTTALVAPFGGRSAASWPMDIRLKAAPTKKSRSLPAAVFIAAACGSRDPQVFAAYTDDRSGHHKEVSHRSIYWATESSPDVFTPRFDPTRTELAMKATEVEGGCPDRWSPLILVIADPGQELALSVAINPFSIVARCLKSYLGHILAAWLGMEVTLDCHPRRTNFFGPHVQPIGIKPARTWGGDNNLGSIYIQYSLWSFALWFLCPPDAQVDHEVGFRGGAPDGFMHLFCLALGLALATLNNLFMSQWRMISACFFRCCLRQSQSPPRHSRRRCWDALLLITELAFWLGFAGIHPSACLVLLICRSLNLQGTLLNKLPGSAFQEMGVARLLRGHTGLLLVYNLTYAPSLVLSIWIFLGQQSEASDPKIQESVLASIPSSRHFVSPWVDGLPWKARPSQSKELCLPSLGLVLPILSVVFLSWAAAVDATTVRKFQRNRWCINLLSLGALYPVRFASSQPDELWFACQPFLFIYMLDAAHACWAATNVVPSAKSE